MAATPPNNNKAERTFVMVKPDGVQRGLVHECIKRFEERGYKLVAMKFVQPSRAHVEAHYADLKGKPFFDGLCAFISSAPNVPMVWEGTDAVRTGRRIIGATNPLMADAGTLRGDFCLATGRNIIHASDTVDNANKEIAHWFKAEELVKWTSPEEKLVYE